MSELAILTRILHDGCPHANIRRVRIGSVGARFQRARFQLKIDSIVKPGALETRPYRAFWAVSGAPA